MKISNRQSRAIYGDEKPYGKLNVNEEKAYDRGFRDGVNKMTANLKKEKSKLIARYIEED